MSTLPPYGTAPPGGTGRQQPVPLGPVMETVLAQTTDVALMPGFLDPINLLNSFGTWMLGGLLLIVFIESGLLFPLLPGDYIAGDTVLVGVDGPDWISVPDSTAGTVEFLGYQITQKDDA